LDISAAVGTPGTLVFDLATTNASDLITLTSGKLNIGIGALSLASLQIGGILDASQTTYTLVHTVDGITGTMMGGGTSVSGTLPGSSVGAILSISEDGKDLVLNLTSFPPPKAVTWKGNIFSQWENVTTNWVVTGTSTPTNFMYSDTVTFDDSGSATATITSIAPVTPGSVIVSNSVNAYTISAAIAGSGSLTKLGTNTLTLGVANSFTGGLYINNGTVGAPISTAGAFGGSGTGRVYLNADLNASATLSVPGNATTANPITVQGAGTNIILAASSQAPSSSGAITLYNNLYLNNIGAASVSQLTLSGSITGTGNITFASTSGYASIQITGASINPVGAITNSCLGTNAVTIAGAIGTNVTDIVQNSTSSGLTLSGSNAFTGNLYIKVGTLSDKLGGNYGDTRNWGPPTATIYLGDVNGRADATLATASNAGYNGPASSINPIIVQSGSGARIIRVLSGVSAQAWIGGNITLSNNLQFINNGGKTFRIGGNITGTGNLTFASTLGSGPIQLTGASINPVGIITNSSLSTGASTIDTCGTRPEPAPEI
jgi:autotransporter-associated beta strand protein